MLGGDDLREITNETIKFPCDVKDNLKKFVNTSKIDIDFVGRKISFKKTNLTIEDPCRIIFSNKIDYLEVLLYSNDKSFYISNFNETLSLNRLISIVNKYL